MKDNIYIRNGYDNRKDYLQCLADDYGANIDVVYELASVLGPNEDFDGLVSELEDYMCMYPDGEVEDEL